ncbi:hypothetical protein SEUCBS139899_009867 [Sporothrix eucalyptigena]
MEFKKYETESNIAWSALHTAFGHESELTQEFAQDMSTGADVHILNKLVEWAGRIKWPPGSVKGYWTKTALTVEECAENTRPFMEDHFWPFTKTIRIHLNAQVLKSGIVLADLPGLKDGNFQ